MENDYEYFNLKIKTRMGVCISSNTIINKLRYTYEKQYVDEFVDIIHANNITYETLIHNNIPVNWRVKNYSHSRGWGYSTPLAYATLQQYEGVMETLLQAKANPNLENHYTYDYPLDLACRANRPDLVKLLIENLAMSHIRAYHCERPLLHEMIVSDRTQVLQELLKSSSCNINRDYINDFQPETLLSTAIRCRRVECVRILLEHKADVNYTVTRATRSGITSSQHPLIDIMDFSRRHLMTSNRNDIGTLKEEEAILRLLLSQTDIDINAGYGYCEPLTQLAQKKQFPLMKILMEHIDKINDTLISELSYIFKGGYELPRSLIKEYVILDPYTLHLFAWRLDANTFVDYRVGAREYMTTEGKSILSAQSDRSQLIYRKQYYDMIESICHLGILTYKIMYYIDDLSDNIPLDKCQINTTTLEEIIS